MGTSRKQGETWAQVGPVLSGAEFGFDSSCGHQPVVRSWQAVWEFGPQQVGLAAQVTPEEKAGGGPCPMGSPLPLAPSRRGASGAGGSEDRSWFFLGAPWPVSSISTPFPRAHLTPSKRRLMTGLAEGLPSSTESLSVPLCLHREAWGRLVPPEACLM